MPGRFRRYLVLLLFAPILACHSDPVAAAKRHAANGDRFSAQGNLREAAIEFQNAVQLNPNDGEARLKLADLAMKAGDVQTAKREYVRAADLLPASAEAQIKAGELLLTARQFEDAKSRADRALQIDRVNARALVLRGNALAGLKDMEQAIAQVEEAIRIDPDGSVAYSDLGALQLFRGNREEAETAFRKAVQVDPKSVQARLALANFYWAVNDRAQVEKVLMAALDVAPRDVSVNRYLAYLYLATNRGANAEAPLKVITEQTKSAEPSLMLADYYQAMKRNGEALAILDRLAADPATHGIASARKANILFQTGHKSEAYAVLAEALQKQPHNEAVLLAQANLLYADRRPDEALKVAKDARAAAPSSAGLAFAAGRIQAFQGSWDDAIQSFVDALKISPTLIPAQVELAKAYLAAGRSEDALHAAENAEALQRGNTQVLLVKSRALLTLGNTVGAEQTLRALPADLIKGPNVQTQLGLLETQKHDLSSARQAFQAALASSPDDVDALTGLTRIDLSERKNAAAVARINAALVRQPRSSALLVLAGQTSQAVGKRSDAEQFFRRAIDADAQNFKAYLLLGEEYAADGRIDEAIAQIDRLSSRKASSVTAHTLVGMLLEMQHKRDEARKRYESALSVDPRAAVAANNLAMIYLESGGNLDLALQLAQTAKAQLPNTPEVSDTLGLVYYRKGLAPLAVTAFQESAARDPKNAGYLAHLGLAYAKAGNKAKALESLTKAFSLGGAFPEASEARATLAQLSGRKG